MSFPEPNYPNRRSDETKDFLGLMAGDERHNYSSYIPYDFDSDFDVDDPAYIVGDLVYADENEELQKWDDTVTSPVLGVFYSNYWAENVAGGPDHRDKMEIDTSNPATVKVGGSAIVALEDTQFDDATADDLVAGDYLDDENDRGLVLRLSEYDAAPEGDDANRYAEVLF